ncbi:MAG: peptidylprolyl isomerase [Methylococcaceae bacterium]|jgi:FKBP-type peptidyl-prolyl cis-trans isomerase SlyD
MQIKNNTAVSIHYTLTNDAGEIIDSSIESGEPLSYLHGTGSIISGLEAALHGRNTGDKFKAHIPASDAYGQVFEDRVQVISREMFDGIDNIEVGMQFHADVSEGPGIVTVVAVEGDNITIDGNHPLAGMPLNFDIEIVEVRDATEEEIEHGHIHGAGGHHH